MNMFVSYMPLVASIWLLGVSLVINTQNFKSALVFKVIPFFMGLGLMLVFLVTRGVGQG